MNTQDSRQSFIRATGNQQELFQPNRFVKIFEREDRCDIPIATWRFLTDNYEIQTWKGIHMDKSPIEIALYPMLLYELQPKTIIELGAFRGGSAVWLADHLELFGINGDVYSIDINLALLDARAKADSRILFLEGDCNNIRSVLPPERLSTLRHPWLVIEDSHVNIVGIVEYFHFNGLQSGDYLIIEDTNQYMWAAWSDWEEQEYMQRVMRKYDDLKQWLMMYPYNYLIDTYYQDMFGYNASKNWNSFLRKMRD